MIARTLTLVLALTTTGVGVRLVSRPEAPLDRRPLALLSNHLSGRTARDAPLDPKALQILGVSDHVNRLYTADGQLPVSLYVGFYASQRTGKTIHSPMKCLPGNGWQPLTTTVQELSVPDGAGERRIGINRYLVQHETDKMLVFFWYQLRGRVESSEYAAKWQAITGALQANRTDGALVRVIVPLPADGNESDADRAAQAFIRDLFPTFDRYLPL